MGWLLFIRNRLVVHRFDRISPIVQIHKPEGLKVL